MSPPIDSYIEVVKEVEDLVALPAVCLRVMDLINDPHSTAKDLERLLVQDPPLTAQLLRMANSSFYGLRAKVDTVSRAVSVIGTKRIGNLVLALSAVKSFGKLSNGIISIENFWHHSIYTGLIASLLARHTKYVQDESIFIAGLLHDIGQLVIFYKRPDQIRQALTSMQEDASEQEFYYYEQKVLGYDHMQVGAELATRWGLPDNLIECIGYHHVPENAVLYPVEVGVIHIANTLANLVELNSNNLEDAAPVSPRAWEVTRLNPEVVQRVIQEAQTQYDNTQSVFLAA